MSGGVRRMLRNPVVVGCLIVLLALVIGALFGGYLTPYGPNETDIPAALQGPSAAHWFGTDELGRDVFTRVIVSCGATLKVSVLSVAISVLLGVPLGLFAGYLRGAVDSTIMRLVDVMFAFPVMLLAIAIVAVLGPGLNTAIIAIGVVYTPIFARVTRGSVLQIREEPFIRAQQALGAGSLRILWRHVLPNVSAPIIVQTSLSFAFAILSEAALSFLGLGVQPPAPSWGRMLFDAKGFFNIAPWLAIFPGLAIFVTVLAFNLLGDSLRDALDPRFVSAKEAA
ncbi:ABC transporter permease [Enemella evansiae]|nr:ABC transporter permease [Enemella evansiae]PFG67201.1 peptide/nickel transport system permease protein [Propionibacteriaceae bacterium ES.041]